VIFAKQPVAGRVKTRLIPALGAEGAAELARAMLARTVAEALASGLKVELCGEPDAATWFEGEVERTAQGAGGLGERLARAAERVLAGGKGVLLIGADCPELDAARLRVAAEALDEVDAVIHPAADGGYVLLGLRGFHRSVFEGVAWSTDAVCAQTLERVRALGWSVRVLETLRDVDEVADLHLVRDLIRH
jgi:rSAM/selenodomain-associated transferase 1